MLCISLFPFIIGLSAWYFFKESVLSKYIFLYTLFFTLWQIDVSVLYSGHALDNLNLKWLFKIFRIGPTMSFAALMTIFYVFVKKLHIELSGFFKYLLHHYTIIFIYLWSIFVYIIGLTPYEITALNRVSDNQLTYLFPQYGSLIVVFYIHILISLIGSICLVVFSFTIKLKHFRQFFILLSISAFFVCVIGSFNFAKVFHLFPGSMAVSLFVIGILFSYSSLHRSILNDIQHRLAQQSQMHYFNTNTSNLIHEIKNPLTVLQGFIDILVSESNDLDKDKQSMINHINMSTKHLKSIVSGFSEFIKSGKMTYIKCNINDLINSAITLMKNEANKDGIAFSYETYLSSDATIYLDEDKMRQVLINLYKNSIEAIPSNSHNKSIQTVLKSDKSMIVIEILDTGKGIPKEKWQDIFKPFETSKELGMGLGLSIVNHIIMAHNGYINIVKSNETGTHIRIELPKYNYNELFS